MELPRKTSEWVQFWFDPRKSVIIVIIKIFPKPVKIVFLKSMDEFKLMKTNSKVRVGNSSTFRDNPICWWPNKSFLFGDITKDDVDGNYWGLRVFWCIRTLRYWCEGIFIKESEILIVWQTKLFRFQLKLARGSSTLISCSEEGLYGRSYPKPPSLSQFRHWVLSLG